MSSFNWPPQGSGSGGGVSSLNSLTGALTLVAGSGITITPSGSNITFTATGSGGGSVTTVSVVSANGLAGTVANASTTPAITLSTTVTGVLKGNGTAISAATAGTDYSAGTSALTTGLVKSTTSTGVLSIAVAGTDYVIPSGSITGTAGNITATSNSTLTTLSALSLPGSQVTGNISGNAANITATTNSTLTTLSALSLPGSQVSGNIAGNAANITATTNSTLTTLSALSLPGAQVTGNISGSAGSVSGTNVVTNTNLSQMATYTIKGNNTGATANAADLTVAQVNAILPVFTSTLNGLVPLSGGGTTNFLRADGTWAAAGGGSSNPITLTQITTPSSPTAGSDSLYFKSDNNLYILNSAGKEVLVGNTGGAGSNFYASSQVTTDSSSLSSATFVTFSNSPALTFSPTVSGTYKVYCSMPTEDTTGTSSESIVRVVNTSGSATLLNESQAGVFGATTIVAASFVQSVYNLTAGTSYVFDLQGKTTGGGSMISAGSATPFYMFAEFVSNGTATGTVTSASVVSANGFAGTVATATSTPAITISTTITGVLKGNGTAISAATAGTDYLAPGNVQVAGIGITIDGGGSVITTGVKGYLYVPYNCTINSVTMLADQSGSIVVDVWKVAYASFPPTVTNTITASALPTITSAQKSQNLTLTGWTTSVSAGDTIAFNVNSATTITRLNMLLAVTKT